MSLALLPGMEPVWQVGGCHALAVLASMNEELAMLGICEKGRKLFSTDASEEPVEPGAAERNGAAVAGRRMPHARGVTDPRERRARSVGDARERKESGQ